MKKRILFVDDEVNVLQGLRRMLNTMRHEWDMVFVESGQEVLPCWPRPPATSSCPICACQSWMGYNC